jgi:hypothetical protein
MIPSVCLILLPNRVCYFGQKRDGLKSDGDVKFDDDDSSSEAKRRPKNNKNKLSTRKFFSWNSNKNDRKDDDDVSCLQLRIRRGMLVYQY